MTQPIRLCLAAFLLALAPAALAAPCTTDAQCAAGNWCDEVMSNCLPQLANGQPIPSDPPHVNPTLNGVCTTAAGVLVCVSGVCDATDNKCGYANGDGPCTAANGPVVCRSGACSVNDLCVPAGGCNVDADCTAGNWCDESIHQCTPRTANGFPIPNDPAHANPTVNGLCTAAAAALVCVSGVCDANDNDCGYADGDGPCNMTTGATVCRSGRCSVNDTCEPPSGCNVDGDCTGGQWCDETALTCTPQVANGAPMPRDAAHRNPTLNGTCTAAAAALVCVSAVCDSDNACGLEDGSGPCTVSDAAVVCRSGQCNAGNLCGPAVVDAGMDAGTDAGSASDAGMTVDAGDGIDSGLLADSGHPLDAGGTPDAGPLADAGGTPGGPDAGNGAGSGGGCGCATGPSAAAMVLLVLLLLGSGAKRRERSGY